MSEAKGEFANRIITLRLSIVGRGVVIPDDAYEQALGYLATWGMGGGRIVKCFIYGDDAGNLDACYSDDNGETVFQIGAIWRKQHSGKNAGMMGYDFNS